ncbi:disulfide bond formation protein B, partial [Amylibacter sp.]|nr:disulfide bond formation protein B [Amylibacter sp.]
LSTLTTAGIGFYHAGVEYKWWSGPSSCTSKINTEISASDLLNQILSAPIVRCDDVVWDLFSISMAGWNGILSIALSCIWASILLKKQ